MNTYYFGIDIGGTSVKAGLFAADETLVHKWSFPSRKEKNGTFILPDLAAQIDALCRERNIDKKSVAGIGIALPGPVIGGSTVLFCDNLGLGEVDVTDELSHLTGIGNIVACNDANAAALGELWMGAARGRKSAVMVTIGTGIGAGVISDGKIISGKFGAGGEIGHMTVVPGETIPCSCGKHGCLEQYASATGIVRMAKQHLETADAPSRLRSIDDLTAKDVFDAAALGDELALSIVDEAMRLLALALSHVSAVVDPGIFVIGGGVAAAGETLLSPLREHYRTYAYHASKETVIRAATLGNDAGICGAAKLAFDTFSA